MRATPLLLATLLVLPTTVLQAQSPSQFFGNSYAIVVGIRDYRDAVRWPQLKNSDNDAAEIAGLLQARGFEVKLFVSEHATKQALESYIQDTLAPQLQSDDRVIFYFSGHGETLRQGGRDWGFVIPYDATDKLSSWISMNQLRTFAGMMGSARHQLFIFDACFGGIFGLKSGLSSIPEDRPGYVRVVAKAKARQYLTAGGAQERTPAESSLEGYTDYSFYTAHLVKAMREDTGDLNGDGVITASELDAYLGPAARSQYNTPRGGSFAGHEQGNFVLQASRAPRLQTQIPASGVLKGTEPQQVQRHVSCSADLPARSICRDRLVDGSLGPEMVVLPGGRFQMGSPMTESERDDNERQHWVDVDAVAIGRYEVTFAEYDLFANATGRTKPDDEGWGRGRRPVINVSWYDATAYAAWLTTQTGRRYRLPSEPEWEYAARAGTTSPFWFGDKIDTEQANYDGQYRYNDGLAGERRGQTLEVGQFEANPFGLYDVHGNVVEWTCSVYEPYPEAVCRDAERGRRRVFRGGAWSHTPGLLRSAERIAEGPGGRSSTIGFRLARAFP